MRDDALIFNVLDRKKRKNWGREQAREREALIRQVQKNLHSLPSLPPSISSFLLFDDIYGSAGIKKKVAE
jgi:hypothetical protein